MIGKNKELFVVVSNSLKEHLKVKDNKVQKN